LKTKRLSIPDPKLQPDVAKESRRDHKYCSDHSRDIR